MKRRNLLIISIIAIILSLLIFGFYLYGGLKQDRDNNTSEQQQNQTGKDTVKVDDQKEKDYKQKYVQLNRQLSVLLPEKENFKWIYNGFAEYGHTMILKSISKKEGDITYDISGTVEDMSGGEGGQAPEHFDIKVMYVISEGALIQKKTEQAMMDSIFDNIELIRTPLSKNNKWVQDQVDKTGKKYALESEITDIAEENGLKVYTISYKDTMGDYYEIRKIKEGFGVISFVKPWKDQDNNQFELGYSIYSEASGYR